MLLKHGTGMTDEILDSIFQHTNQYIIIQPNESKQDQLDATDSGLFNQLYLNMFRVSLRPSSGE
jgi:hypothetical protein